jgi:two-component system, cell cycle response regulator
MAMQLDAAAGDGDHARVKQLLMQLLQSRSSMGGGEYGQLAALEDLFYAMRTLAVTDDLTGLYNRRGFVRTATRMLEHLACENREAVLLYVDVDNLKRVNDSQGHAAGDQLLRKATTVLRGACGEGSVIGRVGGDEFAVVARASLSEDYGMLRTRVERAVVLCNATPGGPPISMSIGVARFDPQQPLSIQALMDQADRAMYREKLRKSHRRASPAMPCVPGLTASGL